MPGPATTILLTDPTTAGLPCTAAETGTFAYDDAPFTVTLTPFVPLAADVYTVTVLNGGPDGMRDRENLRPRSTRRAASGNRAPRQL